MGVGRGVAGVIFRTEAGECVGNGEFIGFGSEVEDDERLAFPGDGDGSPVITDIGLKGDDPCLGVDFLSREDNLAAVLDFHGFFGIETRGEMDDPGLVCVDVDKDAIGRFAG